MSLAGGTQVQDGVRLPRSSQFKGFENWVLWLKRFPRGAIEAMFLGVGAGDFPNRALKSSDDHDSARQAGRGQFDEAADPPSRILCDPCVQSLDRELEHGHALLQLG